MLQQNLVDRLVSYLSPNAGLRRLHARAMMGVALERGFDGASRKDRLSGWKTSGAGANTENRPALGILRDRSRDLSRNNPWAVKALNAIVTNTIGTGIVMQPVVQNKKLEKTAQNAWKSWADTTACDFDGRGNFGALQTLALRTCAESGEALIVRRRASSSAKLPVPFQVQVIEPDFIDTSKEEYTNGANEIKQGIEFDSQGRRVAYWLYPEHPGEMGLNRFRHNYESKRVPAEDVIHLFRQDRAGQIRGLPWGHAVIVRLHDLDEFEDATLMRQKVAACFAGFVRDSDPGSATKPGSKAVEIARTLEPASVQVLGPGQDMTFSSPPGAPQQGEYTTTVLQGIAAGYLITYEALTGDYSKVNFSSGRMGHIEFQRNLDSWRWNMFIPQMCAGVWKWFQEGMAIGINSQLLSAGCIYTAPRREMIDPTKEVPAQIKQIRGGLRSWSETVRENGDDPIETARQISEDNKLFDKYELTLDSDPRKTNNGGQSQAEPKPPVAKESEDDSGEEVDSE
jgi:lambda family phage portal protein